MSAHDARGRNRWDGHRLVITAPSGTRLSDTVVRSLADGSRLTKGSAWVVTGDGIACVNARRTGIARLAIIDGSVVGCWQHRGKRISLDLLFVRGAWLLHCHHASCCGIHCGHRAVVSHRCSVVRCCVSRTEQLVAKTAKAIISLGSRCRCCVWRRCRSKDRGCRDGRCRDGRS